MKPTNDRKPLLLPDGETVQCKFLVRADAPVFWERCETPATEKLNPNLVARFVVWQNDNPHAIIELWPGDVFVCDTHKKVITETIGE